MNYKTTIFLNLIFLTFSQCLFRSKSTRVHVKNYITDFPSLNIFYDFDNKDEPMLKKK